MWSISLLTAGVTLCISFFVGLAWFQSYMTEGTLLSPDLESNVLVALSDESTVREALLSGCHSVRSLPILSLKEIASGRLAEVPSGVRMHIESWGKDPYVETMTIAAGRFTGRQVWACSGQFALLHAWP
jgi:hypothetical protein